MKLASFRAAGVDRIGFVDEVGRVHDLAEVAASKGGAASGAVTSGDMQALIEAGPKALEEVATLRRSLNGNGYAGKGYAADEITWQPPVRKPSKITCVPNNNTAFSETIMKRPKSTTFFLKSYSSLVGNGGSIVLYPDYGLTYSEPELAVVIGRTASRIKAKDAYDYVFGYTIHNDVTSASLREEDTFHYREAMPDGKGGLKMIESYTSYSGRYKSADTFAPLGPWLVTRDEIADPHNLDVSIHVGGKLLFSDNTKNLTYYVPEVLEVISRYTTLLPGDVVSMGTASAPGGEEGEVPLASTDIHRLGGPVRITIAGLGELSNPVDIRT